VSIISLIPKTIMVAVIIVIQHITETSKLLSKIQS